MKHSAIRTRILGLGLVFALVPLIPMVFAAPASAQGTISGTYCITGNSNGTGWSFAWEYNNGSTTFQGFGGSLIPAGSPCGGFVQAMADSMNQLASIPPEYVASVSGCCLVITMSPGWSWDNLWVGATNPMDCLVTVAGCTFNPTIVRLEDPVATNRLSWGALKSRYRGPANR